MAQKRSINVVTLKVNSDAELLGYLGFKNEDAAAGDDGSTTCEITHGGYRAEAFSDGQGILVALIAPVTPRGMDSLPPDTLIELRNGHSLAREKIRIPEPDNWVVTAVEIGDERYEYPDGETVDLALKTLRRSTATLHENREQFRTASRAARRRQNPAPGPR